MCVYKNNVDMAQNELITQLNTCLNYLTEPLTSGSGRNGSTYKALLVVMCHCPVISREVVSFYFPDSSNYFKRAISTMTKKELVSARVIKQGGKNALDGRTKKVYVLTKKGYDEVIKSLLNPPEYYYIRTDNYLMHYYAEAHVFFSLLKRGIEISGYHLEKQLGIFAKSGVQPMDLYCDIACTTRGEAIFFEQDMGTEGLSQLMDKFERYNMYSDKLLVEGKRSYIILLFKQPYINYGNSPCFSTKPLNEIIEVLKEEPKFNGNLIDYYSSLQRIENKSAVQLSHYTTISDMLSKFPYLNNGMSAAALKAYVDGIDDFTGREYYTAFNNRQEQFACRKRHSLLAEFYRNYMSFFNDDVPTEPLRSSFKFFLENRQCYLGASTNFSKFLDFFYGGNFIKVEALVKKYYPYVKFWNNTGFLTFNSSGMASLTTPIGGDRDLYVSLCNAYIQKRQCISVEFPTINIGSFIRVLHFRTRVTKKLDAGYFNLYLGVPSLKEAIWLADILKLRETPYFGNKVYKSAEVNYFFFNIDEFLEETARIYTLTASNEPFYFDKVEVWS